MKSTEYYEYSIVNSSDTSHVYEPDIETREIAREAKKEWKEVDKGAVILQTKVVVSKGFGNKGVYTETTIKEFNIVR